MAGRKKMVDQMEKAIADAFRVSVENGKKIDELKHEFDKEFGPKDRGKKSIVGHIFRKSQEWWEFIF